MPLPIYLAHRLVENHAKLRENGELKFAAARRQEPGHRRVQRRRHAAPHPHRRPLDAARRERDGARSGKDYFTDDARKMIIDKLILPTLKAERPDLLKGELRDRCCPGKPPAKIDDDAIRCHINPTGCFLDGRPARRLRPDRPQDHRRHLRRPRPARRRRVQRQGPDQGRPLGRVHGPLHRQEHRRRRPGRAVRGAALLRHRLPRPAQHLGQHQRHDRARA